jgi:hypothetical protein
MRKLAMALLVLGATVCLAGHAFANDQIFQQTYPLSAGGTFELRNVNGSVTVSAWERNEVEVYAVKVAHGNPRDVDRVQIEVNAQPGKVAVDTRYPQDDGVEVSVEYRIHVPSRAVLGRVATVNGSVRVSGVECTGDLHTVNGDVEALDSAGHFSARTTNGNIRLELRQLTGNGSLTAESVNGNIVLALSEGTSAQLDVSTRNGDFRSELPVTLQGSLGAREFHGQIGRSGGEIRIHTVNGNVRIVSYRPTV